MNGDALFVNVRLSMVLCLFFVLSVIPVYWQTTGFEFIDYDDDLYVVENERVKAGLTLDNVLWAFVAKTAANWHPITLISHMADVEFYGMWAGGHHLTNVFFHISNTLLLFYVLSRMTHQRWMSAAVAILFGIHPLHLDSVVQIAERKDVLSTFFWILTMLGYLRYVESRRIIDYLVALTFFLIGLMTKPMLVTLPFVLLLIDYWPLSRFVGVGRCQWQRVWVLLLEKVPFFAFTIISSIVTFVVQHGEGAVKSIKVYSFDVRLANALTSYIGYIIKTFFPVQLSFYYPHQGMPPYWKVLFAALVLCSATIFSLRKAKTHPYCIVGWLWYLGTLVPVIGIVQVGSQSMADRYTYVPLIGLFVMISWGAREMVKGNAIRKKTLALLSGIAITALMIVAWWQAGHWKNSVSLFERALAVTENNKTAHLNLGFVLAEQGKYQEAISHYKEVLRIAPNYLKAHNNLGLSLENAGKINEAISHYRYILKKEPDHTKAANNLAIALSKKGKVHEAIKFMKISLRSQKGDAKAHNNLGVLLARTGRVAEAAVRFRRAVQLDPGYRDARENLQRLLVEGGMIDRAIARLSKSSEKDSDPNRMYRLGNLYKEKDQLKTALSYYQTALSYSPGYDRALDKVALIKAMLGEYDQAADLYMRIIQRHPDRIEPYYAIASIRSRQGRVNAALSWLQKAVGKGYDDWRRIETDPNLLNLRNTDLYQSFMDNHR